MKQFQQANDFVFWAYLRNKLKIEYYADRNNRLSFSILEDAPFYIHMKKI